MDIRAASMLLLISSVFTTIVLADSSLDPPLGNSLLAAYKARGHQVYRCDQSPTGQLAYTFVRARARLFSLDTLDDQETPSNQVGSHFFLNHPDARQGRASWTTDAPKPSRVTGSVIFSRLNVPPNVPSLLLKASSHSGEGPLNKASYIQRLSPEGGVAPPNCTKRGDILKVFYRSIYALWVQDPTIPSETPHNLLVPPFYEPFYTLYGDGIQPYILHGSLWRRTPSLRANLSTTPGEDTRGSALQNGDNMTWMLTNPSSQVHGRVIQSASVDANGFDWILFKVTNFEGSKDGIASAKYIQMLSTRGGLQPSSTNGFDKGTIEDSTFSAIYWFYH